MADIKKATDDFCNRRQKRGEDVKAFAKDLRKLAESCLFQKDEVDRKLLAQFKNGLRSVEIRDDLDEDSTINFDMAVGMATVMEKNIPGKAAPEVEIEGIHVTGTTHISGRRMYYDYSNRSSEGPPKNLDNMPRSDGNEPGVNVRFKGDCSLGDAVHIDDRNGYVDGRTNNQKP